MNDTAKMANICLSQTHDLAKKVDRGVEACIESISSETRLSPAATRDLMISSLNRWKGLSGTS